MRTSPVGSIKKSQKESLFYKEISRLFLDLTLDNSNLLGLTLTRVKLSQDKGVCIVYFYTPNGASEFKDKLEYLILYRPSLRKALAKQVPSRYTPELVFKFDEEFEKQQRVDQLLEQIKEDLD